MTYTAHSPIGRRIALAVSAILFHWQRLVLATFAPYSGIDFVRVDNKDASLFPVAIPNHSGELQLPSSIDRFPPALVPRKPPEGESINAKLHRPE